MFLGTFTLFCLGLALSGAVSG